MSEQRGEYTTDTIATEEQDIDTGRYMVCERGCKLERVHKRGNRFWVKLGGYPVYAIHGECPVCGAPLHWTNADEKGRIVFREVK